jgi:hypothetical protein
VKYNENKRDSHVKLEVLDGLLSIHHFARKWELRVAVRVIYVHRCVHVGACTVVGSAAVPNESKQSETAEGEGEGSKRDDGGSLIRGTEHTHPEVAASAPDPLRCRDEPGGGKTRSARSPPFDRAENTASEPNNQIRAPMGPK